MAYVRKLLLTLASGSALYSGLVPALGLGGITLHSALNQPLEADIELLQMGDLGSADIRVRLASEADFARSGVERLFFLNDLRFTPLLRGNRHFIRVVSSRPVQEPYLNFVIEVARPNGQLLREYTLLLDPPSSSAYRVTAAPLPAPARTTAVRPHAPAPTALPPATQGRRYQVQRGDSLWLIAKRLRAAGSDLSQPALMDGLYGLNPQAFMDGDRDRLSLGASLLLPDAATATAPAASALPATAALPAERSAESSAQSPTATPAALAAEPAAMPSSAAPGEAAALASHELQQRVDQELAQRAAENRQLQASMLALQAQLQALQAQMQAKDQQLELLRADLARADQLAASAPPSAPPLLVEPAVSAPAPAAETQTLGWHWPAGGLSVLLGGLLGGLWWWRRRHPVPAPRTFAGAPPRVPSSEALVVAPVAPVAAAASLTSSAPAEAALPAPRAPVSAADALEGANIYIAYGRFGEALLVLRQAIAQDPQRTDLRLRLLSVLGELGDGAGFNQEEALLRAQGVEPAQLDHLRARYASRLLLAAHTPAPEPLDDAHGHADELPAPVASTPAALDEFQLNLDDLALDTDWDLLSPFKTAASTRARPADLAAVANDPAFRSDLRQLPEVSELSAEQGADSAFADWPAASAKEDLLLDEAFIDAFSREPLKRSAAPELGDFQHLASNRQNLVKLNKALAYIEQGNLACACDILNEVIIEGDDAQKLEARALLARIA